MKGFLVLVIVHCGLLLPSNCGVSTKLDLEDSATDADDAELKQTIVVTTRLMNRALRDHEEYHINGGRASKKDSGEVPVVLGLKSVGSTRIRTPDSRHKGHPDSFYVNQNTRDEFDIYPNAVNAWKPAYFNWMNPESNFVRRIDTSDVKKRAKENDVVREFYCRKCEEMSPGAAGPCVDAGARRVPLYRTTTEKVRIDGKIAKLD